MPRIPDVAYFNHRPGHSESWKVAAVCLPIGPYPWYATGRDSSYARKVGKRICNEICPVREHCLAYAYAAGIDHGTWGGMDENERARVSARDRADFVDMCRRTPYVPVELKSTKEIPVVTVLAKVKFAPTLDPGEVGPVEDDLARAGIRAGYCSLVGSPTNYDEWMYNGEPLKLAQGRAKPRKNAKPDPDVGKIVEDTATA